jgi:pimeloyl-ACP methyl ester carboxylesterase
VINLLWLFCASVAATFLLNVFAGVICVRQTSSWFGLGPWLPNRWRAPLTDVEFVEFPAADGIKLRGSYLANTGWRRLGVIIFCHELNGDRWNALPYVADLRQRGFDVLSFDFRNQGASSRTPNYDPMPWVTTFEMADLSGAIDYLFSRGDVDLSGVGVIGVSRGAAAALGTAAQDPRIRALVLDSVSPTGRLRVHKAICSARRHIRLPQCLLGILCRPLGMLDSWVRMVLGLWRNCRFVNVDRSARQVSQDVLLVHGENDQLVPLDVARSLGISMPGNAELWSVPGAGHGSAIDAARDEYQSRIGDFFTQHLASDIRADGPANLRSKSSPNAPAKQAREQVAIR